MKLLKIIIPFFAGVSILSSNVNAADYPTGDIAFYNASNKTVTAQVSTVGKFNLAANEQRNVSYSTLSQACSNPSACTAKFYVDNTPAGTATINVVTGKLIAMKLNMKVRTAKGPEQVLRKVVIQ